MRMIRMQKVWKKIGAFVLALVLVVPLLCGAQVTAKAATEEDLLQITSPQGTDVDLKKGDKVTLNVVAKQDISCLSRLDGYLKFDDSKFKVKKSDIKTNLEDKKTLNLLEIGWDETGAERKGHKISIGDSGSEVDVKKNSTILSITLTVIEEVDYPKIEFTDISIKNDGQHYNKDIEIDLHNTNIDNRQLTISVSGNGKDAATKDTLLLSRDKDDKTKSQIAISVEEGSVFNAFKISYKYDPNVVVPYVDKPYEFSDAARAYVEVNDYHEGSVDSDGMVTVNLSVVSTENIGALDKKGNVSFTGDFLYLNFVKAYLGPEKKDKPVTVTLNEATTEAGVTVNKAIKGSSTLSKDISLDYVDKLVSVGDVNDDGHIDLIDATIVLQYYNGVRSNLTEEQLKRADANANGSINLVDVLLIMKYYNQAIKTLPYQQGK